MMRSLNVPLLLLALAIAVVIKFAVHERAQVSELVIDAQVTYSSPGEQLVSYALTEKVRVVVRGPSSDLSQLSALTLGVFANIPPGREGTRDIVLGPENVRFSVSGDFEIVSIEPNRFSIQVEPRLEKALPIRVVLTGEPAAGSVQLAPQVRPARALVTGPASRVERLADIIATVSLDGHARTWEEVVPITSTDPLVQVVQPTLATVTVPMEEPELTISFPEDP